MEGIKVVPKPWGRELWLVVNEHYAMKILEVKKGSRLSLQYHQKKHESMYIQSGAMKLTLNDKVFLKREGDVIDITPGTKHRIEAVEDCRIFEVSTPHLDDVVRVEDDYGRA